jgi:hypothetical protein
VILNLNKREFRKKWIEVDRDLVNIRRAEVKEQQIRNQIELVKLGIHPDSKKARDYYRELIKDLIRDVMEESKEE